MLDRLGDWGADPGVRLVGVTAIGSGSGVARFFGFLALIMASVNIFGGFLVTRRMLAMFQKS